MARARRCISAASAARDTKEEKKKEVFRLRQWEELEAWQQEDNHFIETGYREASGSLATCFRSWTYIHNETVNIYSHLIGAGLFIALPLYFLKAEIPPRYAIATAGDIVVFAIYFAGVAICLSLSAIYHTVMNHSREIDALGARLDFQGVVFLMLGSTAPVIFYSFPCGGKLSWDYVKLISGLGIACSISTLQPHFRGSFIRAWTFGSLALCTMLPLFHGVHIYGWELQNERMGIKWVLITLVLNVAGAMAYALKIPERWCKRRFDVFGASHQIFHIMVMLAALTFTRAILQAFDFAHAHDESCQV